MIEVEIKFKCTWSREKILQLCDILAEADETGDVDIKMVAHDIISAPTTKKEESHERPQLVTDDPEGFTEIDPISPGDLRQEQSTHKTLLTYAETDDGRIAVKYATATIYTTIKTIQALPDKIPSKILINLNPTKRTALRSIKKWFSEIKGSAEDKMYYAGDVDPYTPILTGGAKVDTQTSGKVEGFLE